MNRSRLKSNLVSHAVALCALLLGSCAGVQRQTSPQGPSIKSFEAPTASIDIAGKAKLDDEKVKAKISAEIDKRIAEAKAAGAEAIKFVSTDLYLKASDASLRGDAASAALLYEKLLGLEPKDDYLKKRYSVELIRLGQFDRAERPIRELFESSEESDEGLGLILGGVYTALEKKDEALAIYQGLLKKYPKSEEACIFLSKQYADRKQEKAAMNVLSKCHTANAKNPIFSYYLGKTAVQFGKKDAAKKFFSRSVKIAPSFFQGVLALGLFKEEKKDYEGALKLYQQFLTKEKMNYQVLSRTVQIMFAMGKTEEVIPYAEGLSTLDPTDLNLKVKLGIIYTDHKRFEDAKGIFKEILLVVPDSDKILYYLGSLYQQTEEYEAAIDAYGKIPEESSLYMEGSYQVAHILNALALEDYERGDEERVEQFVSFIEQKSATLPQIRVDLQVNLASFYETVGETIKAIDILSGVSKEENFNENHLYYFASLLERTERFEEAEAAIRALLVKNDKNPHALNFLGYSLLERNGDMKEAYELISKAVELSPEDGYILDSLGWYYYKIGNLEKALEQVQKAWTLVKDDTVINKHLAILHQEMKNYAKAKKYYLEALKFCKVEEEKQELLKHIEDLTGVVEKRLPASIP